MSIIIDFGIFVVKMSIEFVNVVLVCIVPYPLYSQTAFPSPTTNINPLVLSSIIVLVVILLLVDQTEQHRTSQGDQHQAFLQEVQVSFELLVPNSIFV